MTRYLLPLILLAAAASTAPATVPYDSVKYSDCDCLEKNLYYDGDGRLVFTQFILWLLDPKTGEYHVADFIMYARSGVMEGSLGQWRLVYVDNAAQLRVIRARTYMETDTQHDRELVDREKLPKESRRGFRWK